MVIDDGLLAYLDRQLKYYRNERATLRTENADLRARLEAAERERDELRLRLAAVGDFRLPDEAHGFRLPDERPRPSTAPLAGRKEG